MTATAPEDGTALVPLIVGVTGHRDLIDAELPAVREHVRAFLSDLARRFEHVPLTLASSLAAGADLVVTEEALELGIDCIAVLPLPLADYAQDFVDPAVRRRFDAALARCRSRIVCAAPTRGTATAGGPAPAGGESDDAEARVARYEAAGELIASVAFVLLALWDGREATERGGTASIVSFRLERRAWLDEDPATGERELLPRLPPDLVYHLVVSRSSGPPAAGLEPLQHGYRRTSSGALESALPDSARMVAERTRDLDRDLARHADAIRSSAAEPALIAELAAPPEPVVAAARLFHALDWLATRMQRRAMSTLSATSVLSVVMGFAILTYSHAGTSHPPQWAIVLFVAAFGTLFAANFIARREQWHRRYLEYRALAEALRVELFWAIAGVPVHGGLPAAHRDLIKQADPALEWIPNAVRATGLSLLGVRQSGIAGGVEFVVRRWIGGEGDGGPDSEQLKFYWKRRHRKGLIASASERFATGIALVGLSTALLFALQVPLGDEHLRHWLLLAMGLLPLTSTVLDAYAHKTAARELERQYEYMYDVFRAARERLIAATTDRERRAVLVLLGRAALAEHAEWLFVHRDRPIDRSHMQ